MLSSLIHDLGVVWAVTSRVTLFKKLLFPTNRLIPKLQEAAYCAWDSQKPQTNTANGMTHHGETQRTSEKAVRKTKHSYNPTHANGYVAKSGTKTDDVLLLFKHNSHFWGYRPIEETRVTGVKWQMGLDSLKQLSSAAYRVSCLLRATPGNVIMDHEFHAGGAVLQRANITSPRQIKLHTDISFHECGSLSPWCGASSGCGWRNGLLYGG